MPSKKKTTIEIQTADIVPCPIGRTLDILGDRWSLLIVRDVFIGLRRFGELRDNLGVARNILADRLRKLVQAGVLDSVPASDGSAYQEYVLTRMGQSLLPVMVSLRQWGEQHLFAPGERYPQLIDKKTGRPLSRMVPKGADGQPVTPNQLERRQPRTRRTDKA